LQTYKVLFFDKNGSVEAQDVFAFENDTGAILIADWLFDACSDLYDGYELRCGSRRFMPLSKLKVSGLSLSIRGDGEATRLAQEIVLEREQILAAASATIARSRRFIRERDKLEAMIRRRG
jgi:hypothetical protein